MESVPIVTSCSHREPGPPSTSVTSSSMRAPPRVPGALAIE
jgi:hypothetical protein